MSEHGCSIRTTELDFTPGDQCIFTALNARGELLADKLFELYSPKISSGIYYHYTSFVGFQQVISSGNLRFYSTKKRKSIGEFIPFCEEMGLDGYWRRNRHDSEEGEYLSLMDDLYYKSFVSCPKTEAEYLWKTFADQGSGVRLKMQIDVHPDYPDFRKMAYQGTEGHALLKKLLQAYREADSNFVPFGVSRMPAYCQLKEFSVQNECRLLAKRHSGAHDFFPFKVEYDPENDCSFIDCSLTAPTCSLFKLSLIEIETGPYCSDENQKKAHHQMSLFLERYP